MRPSVESVSSWLCRLQFWRCDRHRRKQGSRLAFRNQGRGMWVAMTSSLKKKPYGLYHDLDGAQIMSAKDMRRR